MSEDLEFEKWFEKAIHKVQGGQQAIEAEKQESEDGELKEPEEE